MTALYRVVGHSCRSDRPNMGIRRPGNEAVGCEHVRIDTPLPAVEAERVADLMQRAGLEPHIFEPEETP